MKARTVIATLLALLLGSPGAAAKQRVVQGPRAKDSPACKADADCAFLPTVCGRCQPCAPTWQQMGTRKEAEEIRNMAKRVRCKAVECGACPKGQLASTKNWLGNRAACRKGRCVAEHVVNPEPDTACKVDNDCVFRPRGGCGCPPCGTMFRAAVNRKHAEWLSKQYAIESCPRMKCAKCAQRVVWVGEKAVCRLGECVVLP